MGPAIPTLATTLSNSVTLSATRKVIDRSSTLFNPTVQGPIILLVDHCFEGFDSETSVTFTNFHTLSLANCTIVPRIIIVLTQQVSSISISFENVHFLNLVNFQSDDTNSSRPVFCTINSSRFVHGFDLAESPLELDSTQQAFTIEKSLFEGKLSFPAGCTISNGGKIQLIGNSFLNSEPGFLLKFSLLHVKRRGIVEISSNSLVGSGDCAGLFFGNVTLEDDAKLFIDNNIIEVAEASVSLLLNVSEAGSCSSEIRIGGSITSPFGTVNLNHLPNANFSNGAKIFLTFLKVVCPSFEVLGWNGEGWVGFDILEKLQVQLLSIVDSNVEHFSAHSESSVLEVVELNLQHNHLTRSAVVNFSSFSFTSVLLAHITLAPDSLLLIENSLATNSIECSNFSLDASSRLALEHNSVQVPAEKHHPLLSIISSRLDGLNASVIVAHNDLRVFCQSCTRDCYKASHLVVSNVSLVGAESRVHVLNNMATLTQVYKFYGSSPMAAFLFTVLGKNSSVVVAANSFLRSITVASALTAANVFFTVEAEDFYANTSIAFKENQLGTGGKDNKPIQLVVSGNLSSAAFSSTTTTLYCSKLTLLGFSEVELYNVTSPILCSLCKLKRILISFSVLIFTVERSSAISNAEVAIDSAPMTFIVEANVTASNWTVEGTAAGSFVLQFRSVELEAVNFNSSCGILHLTMNNVVVKALSQFIFFFPAKLISLDTVYFCQSTFLLAPEEIQMGTVELSFASVSAVSSSVTFANCLAQLHKINLENSTFRLETNCKMSILTASLENSTLVAQRSKIFFLSLSYWEIGNSSLVLIEDCFFPRNSQVQKIMGVDHFVVGNGSYVIVKNNTVEQHTYGSVAWQLSFELGSNATLAVCDNTFHNIVFSALMLIFSIDGPNADVQVSRNVAEIQRARTAIEVQLLPTVSESRSGSVLIDNNLVTSSAGTGASAVVSAPIGNPFATANISISVQMTNIAFEGTASFTVTGINFDTTPNSSLNFTNFLIVGHLYITSCSFLPMSLQLDNVRVGNSLTVQDPYFVDSGELKFNFTAFQFKMSHSHNNFPGHYANVAIQLVDCVFSNSLTLLQSPFQWTFGHVTSAMTTLSFAGNGSLNVSRVSRFDALFSIELTKSSELVHLITDNSTIFQAQVSFLNNSWSAPSSRNVSISFNNSLSRIQLFDVKNFVFIGDEDENNVVRPPLSDSGICLLEDHTIEKITVNTCIFERALVLFSQMRLESIIFNGGEMIQSQFHVDNVTLLSNMNLAIKITQSSLSFRAVEASLFDFSQVIAGGVITIDHCSTRQNLRFLYAIVNSSVDITELVSYSTTITEQRWSSFSISNSSSNSIQLRSTFEHSVISFKNITVSSIASLTGSQFVNSTVNLSECLVESFSFLGKSTNCTARFFANVFGALQISLTNNEIHCEIELCTFKSLRIVIPPYSAINIKNTTVTHILWFTSQSDDTGIDVELSYVTVMGTTLCACGGNHFIANSQFFSAFTLSTLLKDSLLRVENCTFQQSLTVQTTRGNGVYNSMTNSSAYFRNNTFLFGVGAFISFRSDNFLNSTMKFEDSRIFFPASVRIPFKLLIYTMGANSSVILANNDFECNQSGSLASQIAVDLGAVTKSLLIVDSNRVRNTSLKVNLFVSSTSSDLSSSFDILHNQFDELSVDFGEAVEHCSVATQQGFFEIIAPPHSTKKLVITAAAFSKQGDSQITPQEGVHVTSEHVSFTTEELSSFSCKQCLFCKDVEFNVQRSSDLTFLSLEKSVVEDGVLRFTDSPNLVNSEIAFQVEMNGLIVRQGNITFAGLSNLSFEASSLPAMELYESTFVFSNVLAKIFSLRAVLNRSRLCVDELRTSDESAVLNFESLTLKINSSLILSNSVIRCAYSFNSILTFDGLILSDYSLLLLSNITVEALPTTRLVTAVDISGMLGDNTSQIKVIDCHFGCVKTKGQCRAELVHGFLLKGGVLGSFASLTFANSSVEGKFEIVLPGRNANVSLSFDEAMSNLTDFKLSGVYCRDSNCNIFYSNALWSHAKVSYNDCLFDSTTVKLHSLRLNAVSFAQSTFKNVSFESRNCTMELFGLPGLFQESTVLFSSSNFGKMEWATEIEQSVVSFDSCGLSIGPQLSLHGGSHLLVGNSTAKVDVSSLLLKNGSMHFGNVVFSLFSWRSSGTVGENASITAVSCDFLTGQFNAGIYSFEGTNSLVISESTFEGEFSITGPLTVATGLSVVFDKITLKGDNLKVNQLSPKLLSIQFAETANCGLITLGHVESLGLFLMNGVAVREMIWTSVITLPNASILLNNTIFQVYDARNVFLGEQSTFYVLRSAGNMRTLKVTGQRSARCEVTNCSFSGSAFSFSSDGSMMVVVGNLFSGGVLSVSIFSNNSVFPLQFSFNRFVAHSLVWDVLNSNSIVATGNQFSMSSSPIVRGTKPIITLLCNGLVKFEEEADNVQVTLLHSGSGGLAVQQTVQQQMYCATTSDMLRCYTTKQAPKPQMCSQVVQPLTMKPFFFASVRTTTRSFPLSHSWTHQAPPTPPVSDSKSLTATHLLTHTSNGSSSLSVMQSVTPADTITSDEGDIPIVPDSTRTKSSTLMRATFVNVSKQSTGAANSIKEAGEISSTVGAVGSALGSGGSAADLQSLGMLGLMDCSFGDAGVAAKGASASVLPFIFWSGAFGEFATANVVVLLVLFVQLTVALGFSQVQGASFIAGCRKGKFPSVTLKVFFFMYQALTLTAAKIISQGGPMLAVGLVVLILYAVVPFIPVVMIDSGYWEPEFVEYSFSTHRLPWLIREVLPTGYWTTRSGCSGDEQLFSLSLSKLKSEVSTYLFLIPFLKALILAVAIVFAPESQCSTVLYFLILVFGATAAATAFFRPSRGPINDVVSVVVNVCGAVICYQLAAGGEESWKAIGSLIICASVFSVFGAIVSVIIGGAEFLMKKKERSDKCEAAVGLLGDDGDEAMVAVVSSANNTKDASPPPTTAEHAIDEKPQTLLEVALAAKKNKKKKEQEAKQQEQEQEAKEKKRIIDLTSSDSSSDSLGVRRASKRQHEKELPVKGGKQRNSTTRGSDSGGSSSSSSLDRLVARKNNKNPKKKGVQQQGQDSKNKNKKAEKTVLIVLDSSDESRSSEEDARGNGRNPLNRERKRRTRQ